MYISQNFVSHNKCLGANDNLSGAISALSIAKYFKDPNRRPKNVEIWCVAFGAEEAGQRGSTDFVMKHKAKMPRTALRYAIEKLDPDLRAEAMQR